MNLEDLKKVAGIKAADLIQTNQKVGLGTGSTAFYAIKHLAERIKSEGLQIQAVSTSFSTTLLCQSYGIPLIDSGALNHLDIAIDGADEIDDQKNLIKGRGGAHTLEKIVAAMSDRYIIIADDSKKTARLGSRFPVPVEVNPKALELCKKQLQALGALEVVLRMGSPAKDGPVVTDSANFILDAFFKTISDPAYLEKEINNIPGVLDNGIFAGYAHQVILASSGGIIEF
jgi:ribose 5-phosphate isomerase A